MRLAGRLKTQLAAARVNAANLLEAIIADFIGKCAALWAIDLRTEEVLL